MNTYLGACQNLTPDDVNPDTVRASSIVYLEGYLWDPPAAKEAFRKAVKIAHEAGNKVALTLSDAFCVDRYRDEFLGLMRDGSLDILFANIHELQSLYGTSDANTALAALREENVLGAITRSAEGALIVSRGETKAVPAFPVERVVDTTGAGDLFASGFLAGLDQEPRSHRLRPPRRPRRRRDHQPSRRPPAGEPARAGAAGRAVEVTCSKGAERSCSDTWPTCAAS